MPIYVVDCGHGGDQAALRSSPVGVVGPGGTREKDVTLALGRMVAERLEGAVLTRDGDYNLSLAARAEVAARRGAAAFVSLHANDGPVGARGAETWIHPQAGARSRALAAQVQAELARLGGPDRGVQEGALGVLAPARLAPSTAACLVEVDYLSDPAGERRLRDPRQLASIADGVARAVRRMGQPQAASVRIIIPDRHPEVSLTTDNNWFEQHLTTIDGSGTLDVSGSVTLAGADEARMTIHAGIAADGSGSGGSLLLMRFFTLARDRPMLFGFQVPGVTTGPFYLRLNLEPRPESGAATTVTGNCSVDPVA